VDNSHRFPLTSGEPIEEGDNLLEEIYRMNPYTDNGRGERSDDLL
jgi:hypothetical protein